MGWLTTEELWWDKEGRLRTHAPSTYKIPLASDRPPVFNVELAKWSENREPTIRRSKAVGEPPFMLGVSVLEALSMAVASVADYESLPVPRSPGDARARPDGDHPPRRRNRAGRMTVRPELLDRLRGDQAAAALVTVETARGSTPREAGAWMVVGPQATLGTIGGGQLEYMAIDAARAMLARGGDTTSLDIPLGPEIGQCCGGRTLLSVARLDDPGWAALRARAVAERMALPEVLIFGAGHVGRALGAALALLPVRPVLVDQRMEELHLAAPGTRRPPDAAPRGDRPRRGVRAPPS